VIKNSEKIFHSIHVENPVFWDVIPK